LLNIGGICNISIKQDDGSYVGFDISAANQALNYLVAPKGLKYDEGGMLASKGQLLQGELEKLCAEVYYQKTAPKSLSNANAMQMVMPFLENENYSTEDKLNTIVHLIVEQIYQAILPYKATSKEETKNLLVTGGGAFNSFLIALLTEKLSAINVSVVVPDAKIVAYKEALVMALIGTLRWREEANVMASQTGASKDSVGGAFWIGN
ncbi:MAG: anhydro-N-acetylmuramic acid kinase, partial [Chitinophagaceae bacterium]|nr:anhydro-N-acetylmuramic acid kinase [Chitinophagaceae bacterium]